MKLYAVVVGVVVIATIAALIVDLRNRERNAKWELSAVAARSQVDQTASKFPTPEPTVSDLPD